MVNGELSKAEYYTVEARFSVREQKAYFRGLKIFFGEGRRKIEVESRERGFVSMIASKVLTSK